MKTIKRWFDELPSPIKEKALTNAGSNINTEMTATMHNALQSGFCWTRNDQGYLYWEIVSDIYSNADPNKTHKLIEGSVSLRFNSKDYFDLIELFNSKVNRTEETITITKYMWK